MAQSPSTPPTPVEPHRYQLWFEQFRDMAVMGLSLAGGGITLLGTIFASAPRPVAGFLSILLFFVAALTALVAQAKVVALSDAGEAPGAEMHGLRRTAFACIGGGVGVFLAFAAHALMR